MGFCKNFPTIKNLKVNKIMKDIVVNMKMGREEYCSSLNYQCKNNKYVNLNLENKNILFQKKYITSGGW